MAYLSGNVIGNLSGKLGNLSARTVNGQTTMAARPSSFNASKSPVVVEVRQKFAVTGMFAKSVLTLSTLDEIWRKTKTACISVFNTIFKANFGYSSTKNQPNRISLLQKVLYYQLQLQQSKLIKSQLHYRHSTPLQYSALMKLISLQTL